MALSVRELRRKVQAIRRIQQITNAMRLVSTARLQRAQAHLRRVLPYCEELAGMLERVLSDVGPLAGPYVSGNGSRAWAVLVVASDRGLCGGYNIAVLEKFEGLVSGRDAKEVLVVGMGRCILRELRKRPYRIVAEFENPYVTPSYEDILPVATKLLALFESGESGEVWAVYTKFESMGKFYPVAERLLPIEHKGGEPSGFGLYEPGAAELLRELIPKAFLARVFRCVSEAQAAEQAARMVAMAQATDNAQELIDKLTVEMNKARQAAITKEIAEVVTSAEVMAGG